MASSQNPEDAGKGVIASSLLHTKTESGGNAPSWGMGYREASGDEGKVIEDVLKLYQLSPTSQAYSHYAPEAVFSDPVSIAEGLDSFKSQFNGMPLIFSKSITKAVKVLDNPKVQSPSFSISLSQEYHFKLGGMTKLVDSLITFTRNGEGKIVRQEEQWDATHNATSVDGFYGQLQEWRKKLTAGLIHTMVDSTPVDERKK